MKNIVGKIFRGVLISCLTFGQEGLLLAEENKPNRPVSMSYRGAVSVAEIDESDEDTIVVRDPDGNQILDVREPKNPVQEYNRQLPKAKNFEKSSSADPKEQEIETVPNEMLVRWKTHVTVSRQRQLGQSVGDVRLFADTPVSRPGFSPSKQKANAFYDSFGVIKLPPGTNFQKALDECNNHPDFEYAEPIYVVRTNKIPNDEFYDQLWGLGPESDQMEDNDIDAPQAWDIRTDAGSIVVAVLDTGVDYTHPDLVNNMWVNTAELNGVAGQDDDGNQRVDDIYGYNFMGTGTGGPGSPNPMDDNSHGTHVAGTIGAEGNNGIGVAGVNWKVQIMALKFLGAGGSGRTDDAISAFRYAEAMGVDIINNSWSGGGYSLGLDDAIQRFHQSGGLVVAAAGNQYTDEARFPSALTNVVSVGNLNNDGNPSPSTNFGPYVDISAPGTDILSTIPNNGYDSFTGTSMASPHVAGVAALLWAHNPTLTNNDIRAILKSSAVDIAPNADLAQNKYMGSGRVNARDALVWDTIPPPHVEIDLIHPKRIISNFVHVYGQASSPQFSRYTLQYGVGRNPDPASFQDISTSINSADRTSLLAGIFSDTLPEGLLTLRLEAEDVLGQKSEDRMPVEIDLVSLDFGTRELDISFNQPIKNGTSFTMMGTIRVPYNSYSLSVGVGESPGTWSEIGISKTVPFPPAGPSSVALGTWDISTLPDGIYKIRLQVDDTKGFMREDQVTVVINRVELILPFPKDVYRLGDAINVEAAIRYPVNNVRIEYGYGESPKEWLNQGVSQSVDKVSNDYFSGRIGSIKTDLMAPNPDPVGNFVTVRLVADNGGFQQTISANGIYIDERLKPGFPIKIPAAHFSAESGSFDVKLSDLDKDGKKEIITVRVYNGSVFDFNVDLLVYRSDGTLWWSTQYAQFSGDYTMPVVGDIDNDGYDEILVNGSPTFFSADGEEIHAFNHDGTPVEGLWPVRMSEYGLGMVIADVDHDRRPEIIVKSRLPNSITNSNSTSLTILDGSGNVRNKIFFPRHGEFNFSRVPKTPAIGNFDDDRDLEIVILCDVDELCVVNQDGSLVEGWPKKLDGNMTTNRPVVGDVDNDGQDDIVVGVSEIFGLDGTSKSTIAVYNRNGNILPGWPLEGLPYTNAFGDDSKVTKEWHSPSLVDFEGDGFLEVAVVGDFALFVFDHQGRIRQGWPQPTYGFSLGDKGATHADMDGDGVPDVVMVTGDLGGLYNRHPIDVSIFGGVFAWRADGTPIDLNLDSNRNHLFLEYSARSWVAIDDIDGDNRIDLVTAAYNNEYFDHSANGSTGVRNFFKDRSTLYAWSIDTAYDPTKNVWSNYQRDNQNTGRYRPVNIPPTVTIEAIQLEAGRRPVNLRAVVKDDGMPQGEIVTTEWQVVDGPGRVRFTDKFSHETTISFDRPGDYVIQLVAHDGEYTNADRVTISIGQPTSSGQALLMPVNKFDPTKGQRGEIDFVVTETAKVEIQLYDRKGQLVRTLLNEMKSPGSYTEYWDGSDGQQIAPSGVYNVTCKVGNHIQQSRMIMTK